MKSREFWIKYDDYEGFLVVDSTAHAEGFIRVIEYSAYKEAMDAFNNLRIDYHKEREQNKIMREALEFYAACPAGSGMIEGDVCGEFIALGTRAREVLDKCKRPTWTNEEIK